MSGAVARVPNSLVSVRIIPRDVEIVAVCVKMQFRRRFSVAWKRSLSTSSQSSPVVVYPSQLYIGDEINSWREIGFKIDPSGVLRLGEMTIHLCGKSRGRGVIGWNFRHLAPNIQSVDGIPILRGGEVPASISVHESGHPNGVKVIDHLVISSENSLRTESELKSIGIGLKRRDENLEKKLTFSFYRPSNTILEVLAPASSTNDILPTSKVVGITFTCDDLSKTHSYLATITKPPWPATQKGRQITTLNKDLVDGEGEIRFSLRIAFLSPHVKF
jgi:hypothetical protein